MSLRCNLCGRDLKPHCPDPKSKTPEATCGWWRCTNQACTAQTYDVCRGILVHHDGRREQLGA